MKIACATTTIYVPKALAVYRKFGPDVKFFVAGDHKTPHAEVQQFCDGIDASYLHPDNQASQSWKSSELIGWHTVRRRAFAVLEALRWGAELIVVWDDDNLMMDNLYFTDFQQCFARPYQFEELASWHGLKATSPSRWFDAGQLMLPHTPHRGFPYDKKAQPVYEPIVGARVGVAAGLCLGDPDIDAVTRIASAPIIHNVSELARAGVVTDPRETWTVFNTQNTAFIREIAPAMFCAPGLGRFDDIVASLITQRVMRSRGLHVHFGQPFVWQQRNSHNLIRDLEDEVWGMANLTSIAANLDAIVEVMPDSVIAECRHIWRCLSGVPDKTRECALAFLDDVESVL